MSYSFSITILNGFALFAHLGSTLFWFGSAIQLNSTIIIIIIMYVLISWVTQVHIIIVVHKSKMFDDITLLCPRR